MRRILISLLLALLCACTSTPNYQVKTLDNGKQVKVIGITKMYSTNGVNKWLILDYQTESPITDIDALKKEADEIWPYFKNDVEQAGMDEALIRANSAPTGTIIKESKSHGLAYKKAADGTWSRAGG
jgi:hypothetical protein